MCICQTTSPARPTDSSSLGVWNIHSLRTPKRSPIHRIGTLVLFHTLACNQCFVTPPPLLAVDRRWFYIILLIQLPLSLSVLGANGRTGIELVKQGLERNYRVTAFVRDDKLLIEDSSLRKNHNLLIVKGSPTSQADLDRCVEGQDVVVNVIGVSVLSFFLTTVEGFVALNPSSAREVHSCTQNV